MKWKLAFIVNSQGEWESLEEREKGRWNNKNGRATNGGGVREREIKVEVDGIGMSNRGIFGMFMASS